MVGETLPRVSRLEQTCIAAPSQWEGQLEDGRAFYVRFRHGRFEVRISPGATDDVMDAVRASPVLEWQAEDELDAVLEEPSMIERAGTVLDFSRVRDR